MVSVILVRLLVASLVAKVDHWVMVVVAVRQPMAPWKTGEKFPLKRLATLRLVEWQRLIINI